MPFWRHLRKVRADTRMASAASGSVRNPSVSSQVMRPILVRCGQAVTHRDHEWPRMTSLTTNGRKRMLDPQTCKCPGRCGDTPGAGTKEASLGTEGLYSPP